MGLRLVPRTIEAIQAAGRLTKYHAIDKPRMEREAAEWEERRHRDQAQRDEAERRRREEEIVYEERRSYAREKGERQAIIEMHEEVRRKQFEHETRMLAVWERAEEIAQQGTMRRKSERDEWIDAIAAVADRIGG